MGVIDNVTGIKVGPYYKGPWDAARTRRFYFSEGKMEVPFAVGDIRKSVLIGEQWNRVPIAAYIIEDDFKYRLIEESKKSSKPPITKEEYQRYRDIVQEGIYDLYMLDKRIQEHATEFHVYFEDNFDTWKKRDSLHPRPKDQFGEEK